MTWGVGVLTWNDPAACSQTLKAVQAQVSDVSHLIVLDNGSKVPFKSSVADVVRQPTNLGAGGGMSATVKHLLTLGVDGIVFLEDDWTAVRPLSLSWLEPFVTSTDVGQVRLAERADQPAATYYTYGLKGDEAKNADTWRYSPHHVYAGGLYQRMRSLWSNNPFACSRDMAEQFLLTGQDEKRMARPYYAAGLTTISTTPGHFRHTGTIRERRGKPGWRK